ncbi:MAG: flagellar basal body protein FliL [Spirochaetaceae bacterium]|nr:flagellar basal body protein FliL [Spirochaetaceae bacterium]
MADRASGFWAMVNRILLIVLLALILFLAGGTVYGLIFRKSKPPLYKIPEPPASQSQTMQRETMFTGIGRLRAVTGDAPPVTVIISVAFPYDPEDGPFTEELYAKIPGFRMAISEYFADRTAAELREMSDDSIKTAILKGCNALLRLGFIETLYFNDLMFIE